MKIALDFDGVLGHTMDLWVNEFNKQHPSKKTTIEDIQKWSFFESDPFNIDYKEAFEIFDYCWRHWEYIKPLEVDQWFKINELRKLGKVHLVSAVVKNKDSIRKWLIAEGIDTDEVVFAQEKWKLNYDIFIDDSPTNASNIKKEGKICLLYDEAWNRDVKTNGKIIRVYSLNHAISVIKGLKENGKK